MRNRERPNLRSATRLSWVESDELLHRCDTMNESTLTGQCTSVRPIRMNVENSEVFSDMRGP